MRRRTEVTIVYKSGAVITFRCRRFTVWLNEVGGVRKAQWNDARPEPLLLRVDEITSVYAQKRWL